MDTETVVEGVVERVTFESEETSFRVVKIAVAGRPGPLPIVGTFPRMAPGARVRVRGKLEIDRKHGEQLRVASLIELAPDTLAGLQKYLASGLVKGVGPKMAERIVGRFGMEALKVLDDEPHRLAEVRGLGETRRGALAKAWREHRALRDVNLFLQAHGASGTLGARIVKRYGAAAMKVLARDPYRLAFEVTGVGFKTADRMAAGLGIAADSPARLQAAAYQVLHDVSDHGHVWIGLEDLKTLAARMLARSEDDEETRTGLGCAVDVLARRGRAVVESANGGPIVYRAQAHAAEVRLAQRLRAIAAAPVRSIDGVGAALRAFETQAKVELAPEQQTVVTEAARRPMLVVTGGPGVGKTTVVRAMLAIFARAGIDVRLTAPTGRAAKRMSEATGAEAVTLHRLLEFEPKTSTFRRGRHRPIEAGAIIVDEASMLDLAIADALAQAIPLGTRLILVGDADQLESVGPGAVLRDVIASGVATCVRLRQIFRQAARSLIVTNAHRINDGQPPLTASGEDMADFFIVERCDPERARATILELATARIPARFGFDPMRDIQVLTPMNRGVLGAASLNDALQSALNPGEGGLSYGTRRYRPGDKVMQLRNDYDRNVFNGDVGTVSSIDPEQSTLRVRFDDREVSYETSDLDELSLAYACTVHKSQGSEYPAVIIPLLTAHFVMLTRNLLYTAVTRGRRLVVLVADPRAIDLTLSRGRREERRTRLTHRLLAAS